MRIKGFLAISLLVSLIVFFLYIVKSGEQEQIKESVSAFSRAKTTLTGTNLKALQKEVISYIAEYGVAPEDLENIRSSFPLTLRSDAWGKRIQYERLSDLKFRLTSAGPDDLFGTKDDISLEY